MGKRELNLRRYYVKIYPCLKFNNLDTLESQVFACTPEEAFNKGFKKYSCKGFTKADIKYFEIYDLGIAK